jgi:hypothetical protein
MPDDSTQANAIAALPCGERMKGALRLVAEGTPYRQAAEAAGYTDHREVYRWAKRAGLREIHTERLVASYKTLASLSNEELERRLVDESNTISTRDLAILSGIASDKVSRYETWGRQSDRAEPANDFETLADRI